MGRRKIEIKFIEDPYLRGITLNHRRKGLFKKANDLATVCDVQVCVIVFSRSGKLFHCANPSVDDVIGRYLTYRDGLQGQEKLPHDFGLNVEQEQETLISDEEELLISQMDGKHLENLSIDQIHKLKERIEKYLNLIDIKQREYYERVISQHQNTGYKSVGITMPKEKKTVIKKMEDPIARQRSLRKRRKGLFKKADELATLCDCKVGVLVSLAPHEFTNYAKPSVDEIIEKYQEHQATLQAQENPPPGWKSLDSKELEKHQEHQATLQAQQNPPPGWRSLDGKELENLSMEQLNQLEERFLSSLCLVKANKRKYYERVITQLQTTVQPMDGNEEVGVEDVSNQVKTPPEQH